MAKKGVSAVSGNTSPVVGEKNTYSIASWYPETELSARNPAKVTWELYKKRGNGKFTSTNIKKVGSGDFTFGQAAAGHTYRLEAYRYNPEGGGLIITPKPPKIPKINKVELFYVDDTKGNVFSFMEKLRARANCVNMFGKELVFTLWEDDANGAGHNASNQAIDAKKARVNKDGIAVAEFTLTSALMRKAARGEMDLQLEFYVTVEYYTHKKHATNNVNVKSPFPQKSAPKSTTSQTSARPKAKDSPAAHKPASKKEEAGILESISKKWDELWDYAESVGTAIMDKMPTVHESDGKSPAIKKNTELPKTESTCICKEHYKDLIWGGKVSCEFRKKVIKISQSLGLPQQNFEGANWLMAVMALETGRGFDPTAGTFKSNQDDNRKGGYVGLIQFGQGASADLGVKRTQLIKMTAEKQLDYVEKYFLQKRFQGKLKTKTDLYLAVNYPKACGHGTEKDYVVYDSAKAAYDDNPIFKRESKEYYIDQKGRKQYYQGKEGSSCCRLPTFSTYQK